MERKKEFTEVFRKLKAILQPYAKDMEVVQDDANGYFLNTHHLMKNKRPLCFGGARVGKNYVSFYLMSVYVTDVEMTSSELKKRMQGKSCFNFKTVDESLFRELAKLTKAGAAKFGDKKFIARLREHQASGSRR